MKKVSLVVMERERAVSLMELREAGVLHLEKKVVSSGVLAKLLEKRTKLIKAAGILRRYHTTKRGYTVPADTQAIVEGVGLADKVMALFDEKKILQEQMTHLGKERRRVEGWGDFDPHGFVFLAAHGLKLIPCELSWKVFNALDKDIRFIVISKDKRGVKALVFDDIPGATPFALPAQSLKGIDARMANIKKRVVDIERELASLAGRGEYIGADLVHLAEEIEFETANAGMETMPDEQDAAAVSQICWLYGFIPADSVSALRKKAAEHGWALIWDDPAPGDKPPTLVRNNAAVRIIQPLFSFLGTVPGYREYDISASYLVFFCLFFAMIFGDAAYGILLFIITTITGLAFMFKKGKPHRFPDAAKLFMLLSCCTVAWGSITGSWFAIPSRQLPDFLHALIIPPFNNEGQLAAFPPFLQKIFLLPQDIPEGALKTRWNIQFLCFSVGAVQLVWGRGKNIKKLLPSLTAIAQAGWLVMMLGLYFLVLYMLLKVPLPPFAIYCIGGGLAVYFIFAEQSGGNFFKNIGKSFSNVLSIFLNAVGSFADIISYIRLFAVGLAGSIIAQSFNSMAIPPEGLRGMALSKGFALRFFAAVLILLFGHALNIVMNALSVVVHGVRLNLLEYAGNHLGMEWSGYAYKPFARKKKG